MIIQSRHGGVNLNVESKLPNGKTGHANENILLVSSSGGGKSVGIKSLIEAKIQYEKQRGRKVVVVYMNDPRNNFENMYCMAPAEKKYHLESLVRKGQAPTGQPIKIWTPIHSSIPKKLIPKQNFFTIPVTFNEDCMKILIEPKMKQDEGMSHELEMCMLLQERLAKDESLTDLKIAIDKTENISDKIKKSINISIDRLSKNMTIRPENAKTNLDVMKILNDPDHYHFLNLNYENRNKVLKKKEELFIKQWFFDELRDKCKYCKHRLILVYSEIVHDAPRTATRGTKIFAECIAGSLLTFRGDGDFITDTQNFTELQERVRKSFTAQLYGYIDSPEDRAKICDLNEYNATIRNAFKLEKRQFLLKGYELRRSFMFEMPNHRIWEEGEKLDKFLSLCKQYHGMEKYNNIVEDHNAFIKSEKAKWDAYERQKKKDSKADKRKKVDERVKKLQDELAEIKNTKESKKKDEMVQRNKQIFKLRNENHPQTGKPFSYAQIAKMVGCSKTTVSEVLSNPLNEPQGLKREQEERLF